MSTTEVILTKNISLVKTGLYIYKILYTNTEQKHTGLWKRENLEILFIIENLEILLKWTTLKEGLNYIAEWLPL